MQEIPVFNTITAFVEAHKLNNNNNKMSVLSGVEIILIDNSLYVIQGNDRLLCDVVPDREIITETSDTTNNRLGPLDVIGKYIKYGPLDENPYLNIERIVKFE